MSHDQALKNNDVDARRETMEEADVLLIGGGVMSATLGVLLHQLDPTLNIQIVEALADVARESSNPWNNAGTGHAALCELNYTKELENGDVDITKALEINEAFQVSKQFWAYLTEQGILGDPKEFINAVPHMSFVRGKKNVGYLRKRFEKMQAHHFFQDMEFTDDAETVSEWTPLLTQGRPAHEAIAATRVNSGTDINFGALTEQLVSYLEAQDSIKLATNHIVKDLKRTKDGGWQIKVRNMERGINRKIKAPFVFVGAGGASLPLLQKSDIPEGKGFGGFPVSGQFLVCDNPEIVAKHEAKVYGKAAVGAPPMSVPHLDTRVIDGKKTLLFGPFAGFSPKFLKSGSLLDLPSSVKISNLIPMLAVGKDNLDLTKYLIEQCMLTDEDRIDTLREFFPEAELEHWHLETAGQRVQIIKKDEKKGGVLQFGTEIVAAEDGSIAALLGASPGASCSVAVMLDVLKQCFPDKLDQWADKLTTMVPGFSKDMKQDIEAYREIRKQANDVLGI
ncbi:malate dehydrogenase (quinone) [Verrucomicrobiaceae bacterium 5K15]|uniref:Probable malate:quinone oxidoreductase n=1 Tax=Oceaniferula flava TaxID=2800421 RepID=A0AAE2VCP2_9BACT|nr:malate dehydrogenase (quinone) [Oceaniferula flavus]MBK1855885.1 malate dehydrogenase (quinone) [Oceaniferula flavus]MBM1137192.1 malate dehydrogenase (quinone) [Oceaniferula flavus]